MSSAPVASRTSRIDHGGAEPPADRSADDTAANQLGAALGGIVAAMSDGCIGIAGAARSGGVLAVPLAELNVSFVRPAQVGVVHGTGAVTRLGRRVGFIEGTLFDEGGRVVARGTGTAIPTPFPDVEPSGS